MPTSIEKEERVAHYELLYIVSNQFTEEETKPLIASVNGFIEKNGGKITFEEFWGKKKLAYKIGQFSHGYYILAEFDLATEKLAAVNNHIRLSHEIIRHMIVTKEPRTLEQIKEEKAKAEELFRKTCDKKEEKVEEKVEVKKEKVADADKIELKDLDEKLDNILKTDNLF